MSSSQGAGDAANPAIGAGSGSANGDHILTFTCPDKPGIVHAVTGVLAANGLNVVDLQQFSDRDSKKFFMRVHFGPLDPAAAAAAATVDSTSGSSTTATTEALTPALDELAKSLEVTAWDVRPLAHKTRALLMVSKIGHCLNDLLFRSRSGRLRNLDIVLVVSNHPDLGDLVRSAGVEFVHLPVTAATKEQQEEELLRLVKEKGIELVVLARYMQVLTPRFCAELSGRIINIHHSFLPSFKGARPYHQAYERGVKIIGATAHFVTADLDEGPIIEQRVARVDHSMGPKELVDEGSNVESQVLAAAVKWYSERRVFLNGAKTVVFS